MWFDERTEANAIAAKSKYDDIYDAAIAAFKRQRAALISSSSQSATGARENEKPCPWIRTAERKPTEKDGDHGGYVLWGDPMFGAICAPFDKWEKDKVEGYRFWMPIPPVPEGKQTK